MQTGSQAANGPICRCGSRGCLETRVGVPAILELFRPALREVTITEIIRLARDGDAACRHVLGDAGRTIGQAAAHLCNLINPQRIILGGDLAAAGPIVLDPLREAIRLAAVPSAAPGRLLAAA